MKKLEMRTKKILINMTEMENQKLETLAKNKNMSKSVLAMELVRIGFKEVTKKEL